MEMEQDAKPLEEKEAGQKNAPGKYRLVGRTLGRIGKRLSIDPHKTDASLTAVTGIILRILALLLLVFSLLVVWRLLSNKGYVLEPFSVPQKVAEESGLTGTVVAARFHDALKAVKEEAASVKADSLNVGSDEVTNLNLSLMGVDISLNSIAYQVGQILGREEKRITGEMVQSGDLLSLNFRMSKFATVHFQEKIKDGNIEAATQILLRKAAEAVVRNTDPYRLAILYFRRKEFSAATEIVRTIIRERPYERAWAFHAWGTILREQGNLEEACLKFQKAVELDSNFSISWSQWGFTLLQMNRQEEAAKKLWRATQGEPQNPDVLVTLGWFHNNNRQYALSDSAFALAVKAAVPHKKGEVFYLSWAEAKFMRDSADVALKLVKLAASSNSESAEGYVAKAAALLLQKDTTAAYQAALQGLELDPENISAVTMVVRAEFGIFKNYNSVINRVQGLRFNPNQQYDQQMMLFNLQAMSYNNVGKHDSAFAVIQRLIAINPKVAIPYTTLAETYAFQGNTEAFYSNLEKALELGFQTRFLDLTEEPYRRFASTQRFKKLMENYKLKG
ncbi:MAG: tetratricopeptide repeat protein [Saprospiraceae bacterium]